MRTLAPLLSLPFVLLGCGPVDSNAALEEGQGVAAAQNVLVPLPDPCRTHPADVKTWYPGPGGDWGSQSWPSDGASYAGGSVFSCTSFVVDVGVPFLEGMSGVPSWYKGAYLHAYWTMPDSPEACATVHAYVRLYSKAHPQDPFALVSATTVSGEWKTNASGDGACDMKGWWGYAAPSAGGDRVYRYAIKVVYGTPFSAARPVTVVVSPLW